MKKKRHYLKANLGGDTNPERVSLSSPKMIITSDSPNG